jgi:hypothetical protein
MEHIGSRWWQYWMGKSKSGRCSDRRVEFNES